MVALAHETDRIEQTGRLSSECELTVVMPCLNEERTVGVCVGKAVATMARLGIDGEVLVIDNGSADKSVEVATAAGARVIVHPLKGYGNALRRGFAEARGRFVVMGDADDSYDFTDLGRFVERLRGGADVVMGNRLAGEIKPGAMPWLHKYVGNPGLTFFLNLLFRTGVGDTHCGMRGFRSDALRRMNPQMPGMELASELVIRGRLAGLRVDQIPITLWPDGRDRRPHLRSFRDGGRHLRFMLLCAPTAVFVLPGLLLILLGLGAIPAAMLAGYGAYTGSFGPTFMFTAALVAVAGAQVLAFGMIAKVYAHLTDPVFKDRRVEGFLNWFTVDKGLIGSGLTVLAGLAAGVPVLWHWARTLEVPHPGQWILAATLVVLGLEAAFASFLVGLIGLNRERHKAG